MGVYRDTGSDGGTSLRVFVWGVIGACSYKDGALASTIRASCATKSPKTVGPM